MEVFTQQFQSTCPCSVCMSSCSGWLRDASVPPVTAETCLGTALAALVYSKELSGSGLSLHSWPTTPLHALSSFWHTSWPSRTRHGYLNPRPVAMWMHLHSVQLVGPRDLSRLLSWTKPSHLPSEPRCWALCHPCHPTTSHTWHAESGSFIP